MSDSKKLTNTYLQDEYALNVEHLTKVYRLYDRNRDRIKEVFNPFGRRYSKDFYALNDISFTVKKGETLGIIGKNGAGKSTLLKIITGVLTPTSGTVQTKGRIASLLELGAGFNPEMTGIENIYFNGTIMGYSKKDMDKRLQNIIDFADIGGFINQPVRMYSSGMFARLAFAVNAYVEPDILIVDEALSVGDVAFQAKCISRMRQMIKNGVTVLFVTHAMNVVKNFCKKCIYLQNGKIEAYGEAEEVADLYLHQVRENMNKINTTIECSNQVNTLQELNHDDNKSFKYDKGLDGRVKQFRQGNGKARITAVDICNLDDAAILTAEYNQKIKIKLYIEGYDTVDIVVGYLIRDNMNLEILGGGNYYDMDNPNIHVEVGKKFIIEFITRVPLLQGTYNFVFVLSTPVDDETAIFVDHIENACFLEVGRREKRQLWSKVHLEEECNIIAIK